MNFEVRSQHKESGGDECLRRSAPAKRYDVPLHAKHEKS